MLKICLIGHPDDRPVEGVKNLLFCLHHELTKRYKVLTLSISAPLLYPRLFTFQPDILHFVLSPTLSGLVAAKLISLFGLKAKTIISAPQPAGLNGQKWLSWLKPDLVLVQSSRSEQLFQAAGFRTQFLPNGVDTGRFIPVSEDQKRQLMQKYHIPQNKFIILHVASLKRGRNLDILKQLQSIDRNQVLIVGRREEQIDKEYYRELVAAGCLVMTEYLPDIEDIYALSDCYLFPTVDPRYCIETPLSVLEAMSCNLPVITTPFGALPGLFQAGGGFFFARSDADFFKAIASIKFNNLPVKTRQMVEPYAWENIVFKLAQIYERLTLNQQ